MRTETGLTLAQVKQESAKNISDIVIKSFKKHGISKVMDGTEDNILFDQNLGSNDAMSDYVPIENGS